MARVEADGPTNTSTDPLRASEQTDLANLIGSLDAMPLERLRLQWRNHLGGAAPAHLPKWLLLRLLAYRLQAQVHGDLDKATRKTIAAAGKGASRFQMRAAATKEGLDLKPGSLLVREWNGRLERVMAMEQGFAWNGATYRSLSQVAKAITGTSWNGHRFFGLRKAGDDGAKGGLKVAPISRLRRASGRPGALGSRRADSTDDGTVEQRRSRQPAPDAPPILLRVSDLNGSSRTLGDDDIVARGERARREPKDADAYQAAPLATGRP